MFEIRRSTTDKADEWNQFVAHSKNGTFLFDRNYMDYHSDRFEDFSLMFYYEGRLYGLMPANRKDDIFQSHAGLTYGRLVMDAKTTAAATVELFRELNDYLRTEGFHRVFYKCIPWMYHQLAAEEISLSQMTFSHQLIRLLFVEQLYRACTILRGEPYHHE